MQDDVVIVGAARTPVGSFNGVFAGVPAHQLGKVAIEAAMARAGIEGKQVSEVIMGQILTAGQGMNPARQASIAAGVPIETPAWVVNQVCGSGLRSIALGYQAILNGDSEIVVAGGQESMSQSTHCAYLTRRPQDGLGRIHRHDDQGRTVGCLQRLPHGRHRRERRQAVADHPPAAGRIRRRLAEQGGGGAEGRQIQDRDRAGEDRLEERRCRRRHGRIHPARRDPGRGRETEARLQQGRHGHRRQRLGHQRRRGRGRLDESERGGKSGKESALPASRRGGRPASILRSWGWARFRLRARR